MANDRSLNVLRSWCRTECSRLPRQWRAKVDCVATTQSLACHRLLGWGVAGDAVPYVILEDSAIDAEVGAIQIGGRAFEAHAAGGLVFLRKLEEVELAKLFRAHIRLLHLPLLPAPRVTAVDLQLGDQYSTWRINRANLLSRCLSERILSKPIHGEVERRA